MVQIAQDNNGHREIQTFGVEKSRGCGTKKVCYVELREKSWASTAITQKTRYSSTLTRDLTRFTIQAKGQDGKWTRKPLAYRESNNYLSMCNPPS